MIFHKVLDKAIKALRVDRYCGGAHVRECNESDFNYVRYVTYDCPDLFPHKIQSLCTHTSQSTARIREMSLVGNPTASRMIARVNTPPAGIPAAPTLDAVAVTLTQSERR